ncbi:MAG: hypothetical protein H6565_06015 [Lewinellaceae bacterium]|nr:hypothetical protein [Lewinellaceae bacterium]
MIAALSWAIKLNSEKTSANSPGKESPTEQKGDKIHTSENYSCASDETTGILPYEDALCRIAAYDSLLSKYTISLSPKVISNTDVPYCNGTQITASQLPDLALQYFVLDQPCELKALLDNTTDNNQTVYAMLGIFYDQNSRKYAVDLIFKAKSTYSGTGAAPVGDPEGNYYYDFTTPCPPMCGSGGNQ